MYLVDKILVDEDIAKINFSCDLKKCKGGCCTFEGEFGAPVLDSEVNEINSLIPVVEQYLSEGSKDTIRKKGAIEGLPGSYSTMSINKRDCVFVYYEGDIAKCSIEKAYFESKTKFRKPLSCQLFPIRVSDYGGTYLYYQKFEECDPGLEKGMKEKTFMFKFLKAPLIRAFGEDWYNELDSYLTAKLDTKA